MKSLSLALGRIKPPRRKNLGYSRGLVDVFSSPCSLGQTPVFQKDIYKTARI